VLHRWQIFYLYSSSMERWKKNINLKP